MNQKDVQGETERALRAATEKIIRIVGPAIGSLAAVRGDLEREGEPLDQSDGYEFGEDAAEAMLGEGTCEEEWCDEAQEVEALLLPLFNAGMERAADLEHKATMMALADEIEANDVDDAGINAALNKLVAGAYAAAAKAVQVRATSEMIMRDTARKNRNLELAKAHSDRAAVLQEQETAILALTPADARQAQPTEVKRVDGDACSCSTPHEAHTWGGRPARYCGGVQISRPTYVTESELRLHSKIVEMESQHAAAIASAEARARLEEHREMSCTVRNYAVGLKVKGRNHPCGCQCGCGFICKHREKLEAAARTPDSTKEPE